MVSRLGRERGRRPLSILTGLLFAVWAQGASLAETANEPAKADPAAFEFFEKSVRPILAERCHGCHGPTKQKGGLRLDSRPGLLSGGNSGPAIVPGKPESSRLVDAINYGELAQMPPKSKLPAAEIDVLTRWIKQGASWGFDSSPTRGTPTPANPPARATLDSAAEFRRRADHWCFQPIKPVVPPAADARWKQWPCSPIDRFLLAPLVARGLSPAPEADRKTLIRRLTFDLTGLPPSPEEVTAFIEDKAANAYERLVERLLASPHYGEKWGRHWLDLVRYAETAGHEFDYDTLNSYRYRDYVVRALNLDLPYDRFVVEQVAGDLLPRPRRHPFEGYNESILGTGFYFLGEGTHSPVDVREDEVRRIDNQIDVLSKTFLGLTLACARCHDHKFDAIRTQDYYALAGFLQSSRHQYAFIDPPGRIATRVASLEELKQTILNVLAEAGPALSGPMGERLSRALGRSNGPAHDPPPPRPENAGSGSDFEDFNRDTFDGWSVAGAAFGEAPSGLNSFRLESKGQAARLLPVRAGVAHSGLASNRLQGVLRSRTFTIEKRYLQTLVLGRGGRINVVVDGYEKIRDPIYGALTSRVDGDEPRWHIQDLGMWIGHTAYIEVADGATADYTGARTRFHGGEGYIAVDAIRMSDTPAAPAVPDQKVDPIDLKQIIDQLRRSGSALAKRLQDALTEYRAVEESIPDPTLALAMTDGTGENERVMIRGNHRNPGEIVPRRFLEVLGGTNLATPGEGSGRLELARRMVDPSSNPLITRVVVNRLWKHHFGEGLVRSPDDFGAMGQPPSNPALLDWLAAELVNQGWSLKAMHRLIVGSSAYRMSSVPIADAERIDPANTLLHRMNVRRLEAEAIRDSMLAVSGRLDPTMFGPSVPPYLSPFMDGRGRPQQSGPVDGAGRRSLYLNVRRNFLNPMLMAFDAPVPFSTMGRRNVSNVPAQALTMMNDPLVNGLATLWADRVLAGPGQPDRARLDRLFQIAFGRPPDEDEAVRCQRFLEKRTREGTSQSSRAAWVDLCHVLMNTKEFIFIN